jgi:hypothetical protein
MEKAGLARDLEMSVSQANAREEELLSEFAVLKIGIAPAAKQ